MYVVIFYVDYALSQQNVIGRKFDIKMLMLSFMIYLCSFSFKSEEGSILQRYSEGQIRGNIVF